MKIYIASDHGGFELKNSIREILSKNDYSVEDLGPFTYDKDDDYVDFAIKVSKHVQSDNNSKGILICKTGIGMSQTANKFRGIRAGEVRSALEAEIDRKHHDSNVLVLGAEISPDSTHEEIVLSWLKSEFEAGRHERRVKKMELIEKETLDNFPMNPRIVPALLGEDIEDYYQFAKKFEEFSARIHVDIMDGEYVKSFSPNIEDVLEKLKDIKVFLAYHLMTKNPSKSLLERISEYRNVNMVYIHIEEIDKSLLESEWPFEIALAIRPEVEWQQYSDLIKKVRNILILPIIPGFYGAEFMPNELKKINEIRNLGFDGEFHIDGSVNLSTLEEIMKFKPDILNVGSAIAKAQDPKRAWLDLTNEVIKLSKNK